MSFHPNDSEMLGQRQNHPITKVAVQRYQSSLLAHGPLKNQRVVSPSLADLGRADNVMPGVPQKRGQFDPKHLIKIKAHGGSGRVDGGDFRVQNAMSSVFQSRLNIVPVQFRVAAQQ